MTVIASQLVGKVEISGADQAKTILLSLDDTNKKTQTSLDQLQKAAQDAGSILANRFSAEVKNAQSGLQDLAVRAEAAGLDVSNFTSLQLKASEAAARLGVAQAQSADAMAKANLITNDASSSAEKIALAQAKGTLAAENVAKAELAAGDAMTLVQGEATRLADALEASQVKSNMFTTSVGTMRERMGGLVSGFTGAIGSVLDFGSKLGMTIMGIQGTVSMFASIGHAVGSMIGDYQQNLTKLVTTAHESQSNLAAVGKGMLDMAGPTGTSIKALSDAMYWVESGGYHGADGLNVLKIAAMGAKAEQADVTGVTKVLTSALNTYRDSGMTAAQAMNTLIAVTGQGKMTLNDLSGAVSNVLPVSAKFGISLADTTAGLATMTMQGDDAASAATHLRQIILALEAPASKGASSLKEIGLSSQIVSDEMRKSLPGAIELITDHLKNKFPEGSAAYNEALKNISGGNKQMLALLEPSGGQLQVFKDNVAAVASAVKKGGDSIMGWDLVQQNFNFRMDQAKAAVGAFGVTVGTALAPMATQLINSIAGGAIPALTKFGDWFVNVGIPAIGQFGAFFNKTFGGLVSVIGDVIQQYLKLDFSLWMDKVPIIEGAFALLGSVLNTVVFALTALFTGLDNVLKFLNSTSVAAQFTRDVLTGIGVAIASIQIGAFVATIPALVDGFIAWGIAAWEAAAGTIAATWPILAIGAAIAVTVAGIILAVQHWGDITNWLKAAWESTVGFFEGVWSRIVQGVQGAIDWFNNLSIVFKVGIALIAAALSPIIIPIAAIVLAIQHWSDIVNVLKSAWGPVPGFFQGIWNNVAEHSKSAWDKVNEATHQGGATLVSWWHDLSASFAHNVLGDTLTKALAEAFGSVSVKTLQDQFATIGQQFTQVGDALRTGIGGAITSIMPALTNLGDSFRLIWQAIVATGQGISQIFVSNIHVLHGSISMLIPILISLGQFIEQIFIANLKVLQGSFVMLAPVIIQIGQFISQIFMSNLKLLQGAFVMLMPILNEIGKLIGSQVLNALQALAMLIGGVIIVALAGLLGTIVGLAKGLATFVQGIVMIITGFVQFFSGVTQVAAGIIALFADLATGHFSKLGADLGVIWNGIVMMFTGVWNIIRGLFTAAILSVVSYVGGFVSTVIQFFTNLYNSLVGHSIIPDLVNGIVSWFASLPGRALGAVQSLAGLIIGFFSSLANDALNSGANIVNQLANGIRGAIGSVSGAITDVTAFISAHLPHSPAKLGPLRDLQLQGSLITEQISLGMLAGMPKLDFAIGQLVKPMAVNNSNTYNSYSASNTNNSFQSMAKNLVTPYVPSGVNLAQQSYHAPAAPSQSGQGRPVILVMNGREVARGLMPDITNEIRYNINVQGM